MAGDYLDHGERSMMKEPKTKSIQFSDIQPIEQTNGDMLAFSAVLRAAEIQDISSGGISFEVSLQYAGTNKIEIHNPLYFIQYNLTDVDKKQRFDNKKPPIPLIHRQGKIDPAADFSFQILAIARNTQNQDIPAQVNTPTITFANGDMQRYFLRISEYMDGQIPQTADIPEGNYQLQLIFSIIEATASKTGERPPSRTLKAEGVLISYKKKR